MTDVDAQMALEDARATLEAARSKVRYLIGFACENATTGKWELSGAASEAIVAKGLRDLVLILRGETE